MGKKRPAAVTLDQLSGVASEKVRFIRKDARAVISAAPSQTKLKASLGSPLEVQWAEHSAAQLQAVMQLVKSSCVSAGGGPGAGTVVGLNAVRRALSRGSLRAVIVATQMQPQALLTQLAAVAHQHRVALGSLSCSTARLGQPFGLLRAAAVGLRATEFAGDHPLLVELTQLQPTVPWPRVNEANELVAAEAVGRQTQSSEAAPAAEIPAS